MFTSLEKRYLFEFLEKKEIEKIKIFYDETIDRAINAFLKNHNFNDSEPREEILILLNDENSKKTIKDLFISIISILLYKSKNEDVDFWFIDEKRLFNLKYFLKFSNYIVLENIDKNEKKHIVDAKKNIVSYLISLNIYGKNIDNDYNLEHIKYIYFPLFLTNIYKNIFFEGFIEKEIKDVFVKK